MPAVARVGDSNTPHLRPGSPCPGHTARVSAGSSSVFVNNRACARVGDPYGGCTRIAAGSPNVFSG